MLCTCSQLQRYHLKAHNLLGKQLHRNKSLCEGEILMGTWLLRGLQEQGLNFRGLKELSLTSHKGSVFIHVQHAQTKQLW